MPKLTIQLKGWKQIVPALVALTVAVVTYSFVLDKRLEPRLKPLVEQRLKIDLQREAGERFIRNATTAAGAREQSQKLLEENENISRLQITSIDTRGWGGRVIAKVQFVVGGDSAKNQVRYYRLKHGWMTGWTMQGYTTERAWSTAWL